MNLKKLFSKGVILALLLVFCISAVFGCNISDNRPDNGGDVDPDENTEASVHLSVGTLMDTKERNLMQTWINEFQKQNKEVSIQITKTYNSMPELINYKSTNTMPDIVWTAGDQHASYSDPINLGYFQNLADENKFEGSEKFFDGFYDEVVSTTHYKNGDTGKWFVPRDYNRLTIYYNLTLFNKYGITAPTDGWTWNDFMETCQQLKAAGSSNAIEWRNWAPVHSTMIKNFGAQYVDENGYFDFDSAEAEAVYNWYNDFVKDYAVIGEGSMFGSYSNSATTPPRAAMVVDTYARLGYYTDRAERNDWVCDAVSFPNFEQTDGSAGYVGAGCSGYAITTAASDDETREWAWKFLKWCMSEQGYDKVASLGVVCPALESMRDSGAWTSYESSGYVVNYRAFVDDSTNDFDLNYQNVLQSTTHQGELVGMALSLWNSALSTSFGNASSNFKQSYESVTNIRRPN